MKNTVLVSAALVGLLAGAAGAQNPNVNLSPGTTVPNTATGVVPNMGINVVPNTGFLPGTSFVTPDGFIVTDGFNTVSPSFFPGFVPGFTSTGLFNPWWFSGPTQLFDPTIAYRNGFYDPRATPLAPRPTSAVVPTLGLTSPPLRPGYGRVRVPGPRTAGVRQRVAGSRQELTGTEYLKEIKPQQVKLASHMENVMEDRPITEGTVIETGATGVLVRYQVDGENRSARFTPGQVFFFHGNGDMATAAVEPGSIRAGSRVLIPLPLSREVRQSVAGSRQESRTSESYSYGSKSDAQLGTRSKVMGSRQSIRGRRPAK